jgi:hypothetical protein
MVVLRGLVDVLSDPKEKKMAAKLLPRMLNPNPDERIKIDELKSLMSTMSFS